MHLSRMACFIIHKPGYIGKPRETWQNSLLSIISQSFIMQSQYYYHLAWRN